MPMARLYLVPTPIGNMDDITLRAVKVLSSVDVILAEDTRTSQVLLKHLGIEKKMWSHHKFNEHAAVEAVAQTIVGGQNVALISDAGTPGISDPGFLLVRTCIEHGIDVETLPGATAFVPALIDSGFPCDRFCFEGFLPPKKGRSKRLQQLATEERTMIFYESPYRLVKNAGAVRGTVRRRPSRIRIARTNQKIRRNRTRLPRRTDPPFFGTRAQRRNRPDRRRQAAPGTHGRQEQSRDRIKYLRKEP